MLTCVAPAKINLVLEVLAKRDDGYHEIRSLVQTISLCDVLSFELADKTSFECTEPSLQTSDNLVVQAAELVRKIGGYNKGAKIKLEKRIPRDAGLGGGSSDAATTLSALNGLWQLKLTTSDLVELAARLGSDVPFFIYGGTASMEGRGEKVRRCPEYLAKRNIFIPVWMPATLPKGSLLAKHQEPGLNIGSSLRPCCSMFLTREPLMLSPGWKVIGGVLRKQVARTFT